MFKFLKANKFNILLTIAVCALPIFTEHVLLQTGEIVVEHYSPLQLMVGYAFLGEIFAFVMVLAVCLVIYFFVSFVLNLLLKLAKKFNLKILTSI